jgi:hypothetical protein
MLVVNERHLEAILREYCLHYNHEPTASELQPTSTSLSWRSGPFRLAGGSSGVLALEVYSVRTALLRDVIFEPHTTTPRGCHCSTSRCSRLSDAISLTKRC